MERGIGDAHRRARDLAATGIDFELDQDEARFLQHHLAGCGSCRRWAAGLQADAVALIELARENRAALRR
jgi:hypothetical protein